MLLNTRRFSQISDDTTSPESTRLFTDSRSSLSGSEGRTESIILSDVSFEDHSQEYGRESKRRKTPGLNSQFDRMIEAMNATYHPTQRPGRRRTHTVSSSSTSDIPQTHMVTYEGLKEGRLGENFSLIKMKAPPTPGGEMPRIEDPAGASASDTPKAPSTDLVINPLPQWLCSTFSTLAAKHPLRLLLPKKPPLAQDAVTMLPSAAMDHPWNSPARQEPDPIFAFSTHRRTESIPGDQSTKQADENGDAYHMLPSSNIPRYPPSMDPLFNRQVDLLPFQFPSPRRDHVLPSLEILPFSTPGPNSTLSQTYTSATMSRSTTGISEMGPQGPSLPPGFDELDFVPFLTPGPGSMSSLVSGLDTLPRGLPLSFELHSQVRSIHDTNSAPSPHLSLFSIPGPSASHVDQSVSSSDGSPHRLPADLCLPPYNAASSDLAPAYSSDNIPEYSYYEDPLTDDSGSGSSVDYHYLDASDLPNIFATPGPGYCAPRLVYFDSPTEDPSDSDPLQPGCEIDHSAIDFRWEEFNRKSIGEGQATASIGPRHDISNLHPRIADPEPAPQARDPTLALTPERVPSPSPFRFSLGQDVSRNTVLLPPTYNSQPLPDQETTPVPRTLAPVFAPAPGIYISPLRGEPTGSIPPAPRRVSDSAIAQLQKARLEESTPSNSQASHDSIESWRDVDTEVFP